MLSLHLVFRLLVSPWVYKDFPSAYRFHRRHHYRTTLSFYTFVTRYT
jgi:hypothetical protein